MVKKGCCLSIFFVLILLTGCWDMVAIEERGFIIGTAIDFVDEESKGIYDLTVTNQFVVPANLGTPSSGGNDQKAFTNVSATGNSMFSIDQKMASLTSKMLFSEHLKVLIVSEKVAKTPQLFADLVDIYIRESFMRRGINVIIAADEAKEVLDIHPPEEKLPAMYIDKLLEVNEKKTGLLIPVRIGNIHEFHLNNISYTIPKVLSSSKRINYQGGAIFHGFKKKMVGTFNKEEMMGLNLITAKNQGGAIEVDFEGQLTTFETENIKSKIKINTEDKTNFKITVTIDVEGDIKEVFGSENLSNAKTLAALEKEIADKAEKLADKAIEKGQKEFNADVFTFVNTLRTRHYDTWKKIKDDWDHGENYFAKSTVDVKTNVTIRAAGVSEQTKSKKKE